MHHANRTINVEGQTLATATPSRQRDKRSHEGV
jgi:hypothetical protein